MANKAIFFITVELDQPAELVIKHIKYQTVTKHIMSSCTVEFESMLTWDSNSFRITSNLPVTITSIQFKLAKAFMLDRKIFLLKQEINKVDIFPERSKLIQNNNHLSTSSMITMTEFKPMLICKDEIAIIRFMTPRVMLS